MKNKIEHKTYGENKLEIPYGWYTISEIEEFLKAVKACDKLNKNIFKKSIRRTK